MSLQYSPFFLQRKGFIMTSDQMSTIQHIAAKPTATKKTFQRRWLGAFNSGGRISKKINKNVDKMQLPKKFKPPQRR